MVLVFLAVILQVLGHPVKNGRKTEAALPAVEDVPVYVECEEGSIVTVSMQPKEDFRISGFELLLVNISPESKGTLHFTLRDSAQNLLMEQIMPVNTLTPGEWFTAPAEVSFTREETYEFAMTADGSDPYFMQLSLEETNRALPFMQTVTKNGENTGSGVSLGVDVVTEAAVTFGDIFYYSVPLSVASAFVLILWILFGGQKLLDGVKKIPAARFLSSYGNDLFLALLFISICISIYVRAYQKGVYITSDSAGYLREAVNLVQGNGFHYDGLSGYDSWFANWPILYPAMIAAVMFVTHTNAYLASKILSMLLAGAILLVLRRRFGKDAWIYSLCLTNIGFLNLTYYTWSEIPFMLFLLLFALVLAKILKEEEPSVKCYVLLGLSGLCCFLTRYYGLYIWFVVGLYLLLLLGEYRRTKEQKVFRKGIRLTVTAFVSGVLSLLYLFMNKLMNGMASGVSRSLWWDDYEKLTNDLIESLLTEIFNIFSLQVPQIIDDCPYSMKVFFLAAVFILLFWFIGKRCRRFSNESALIMLSVSYYVIFIGIRYVSSMDTFYFRFFEPATFLLSIGVIGLIVPSLRGKKGLVSFAALVVTVMITAVLSLLQSGFQNGGMRAQDSYYASLTGQWEQAYAEIPDKSVVIFSNLDFRASWYRPDVVEGMIVPADSWEGLQNTYYGSDYLCIRTEDARTMVEEGDYDISVKNVLEDGLKTSGPGKEYVVIALH